MITISNVTPSINTISQWLSAQLYERSFKSSMLKGIYDRILAGLAPLSQFSFIVATDSASSSVVGICVVEHQAPYSVQLKMGSKFRDKFKADLSVDKHFVVAGFMQVYVEPEYRLQGIGKSLVSAMESEYLKVIQPMLSDSAIPMLSARDEAVYMIDKYMSQCFSIRNTSFYGNKGLFYTNFDTDISSKTKEYLDMVLASFSFLNPLLGNYQITPLK